MSSPADIEVAGTPGWMAEDSTATAIATSTPDTIISSPSRAATATGTNNNNNTTINVNNGNNNPTSAAEAASQKTWNQYFRDIFKRDGRLLLITLGILICMNIPYVRLALYPFSIYSTWIHELCHGMAAIVKGGNIITLQIFPDTSGLATTSLKGGVGRSAVASAGYQGTAVIGFLLLIFRRTKRGPRTGTMVIACLMIFSSMLWIRNIFGFFFIFCMGLVLAGLAWKIPSDYIRNLYIILAVTCSMNAIGHIHNLFGSNQSVNGQPSTTDAHTMAALNGGSYLLWAILWFLLAIVLTLLGIVFAIPGPDEVADFACCGVCQDFGLFTLCNYPGQRCVDRIRGSGNDDTPRGEGSTTTNNNNNNTVGGP